MLEKDKIEELEQDGWKQEGKTIEKTFEFEDFEGSLGFVNNVGEVAEEHQHHPDIDIRYNEVTLTLTTHDEGTLTEKDYQVAKEIENS